MPADPTAATSFRVRPELPDDRRYVIQTWLRSDIDNSGHKEGRLYNQWQRRMMEDILSREGTQVRIASPVDDDAIAGWAVLGMARTSVAPACLYYAYVRAEARRLGIARLLVADLLTRRDVLFGSLPPRVCQDCGLPESQCPDRAKHRGWVNSPIRPPKAWHYVPRINFYEAKEAR